MSTSTDGTVATIAATATDLSGYATTTALTNYAPKFTATSPLSLSAANALSVDLSSYALSSALSSYATTTALATKQATIPQNLSTQTGFVGLWDSFNTVMKGLVCTAPLLVTSASAYVTLALSTTAAYTMGALTCTGAAAVGSLTSTGLATVGSLTCNGDATVTGNLQVNGTLNADSLVWASGRITANGTTSSNTGGTDWTVSRISTGIFRITFVTAHPMGSSYTVLVTAWGALSYVRYSQNPPTSTYFKVVLYTTTVSLVHTPFSFMVMNCKTSKTSGVSSSNWLP